MRRRTGTTRNHISSGGSGSGSNSGYQPSEETSGKDNDASESGSYTPPTGSDNQTSSGPLSGTRRMSIVLDLAYRQGIDPSSGHRAASCSKVSPPSRFNLSTYAYRTICNTSSTHDYRIQKESFPFANSSSWPKPQLSVQNSFTFLTRYDAC
ncbi:hypothetical protein C8J55DRAFT_557471 [Lentinula edodes]|uniref:Uncharacterized protein n=1 Tax=Lentinula lateritia TaxID=40482 RepID=A0A9W9DXH3_9AGAR|nr:hypothetical protein C8J55DRAFT_557471 [Lentinula edodes]